MLIKMFALYVEVNIKLGYKRLDGTEEKFLGIADCVTIEARG
jgi:hypothetical protein